MLFAPVKIMKYFFVHKICRRFLLVTLVRWVVSEENDEILMIFNIFTDINFLIGPVIWQAG